MAATAMRILVIGEILRGTGEILRRLSVRGWGYRVVPTLREARDLLATFDFDAVLASEALPDGRGYDAADSVISHHRSLLVAVALSETCLWLPVIDRGNNVLGKRALNMQTLESELEMILTSSQARVIARDVLKEMPARPRFSPDHPGPQRPGMVRRKYRDRDILPL
jgi:DNA-binding response OmpR family regulator